MKDELINQILEIEWEMFIAVPNEGGKAPCQEDKVTFEIMRTSQALTWSEETLKSYLSDLQEAQNNNRNLLTEKYARMMASNSPEQYKKIEHALPPLDPEVPPIVDKIIWLHLKWQSEVAQKYPYVSGKGRPIHSFEDKPNVTSIETYMRGELSTYSKRTLLFYYQDVQEKAASDINGAAEILLNTMKKYGFNTLDEANDYAKKKLV